MHDLCSSHRHAFEYELLAAPPARAALARRRLGALCSSWSRKALKALGINPSTSPSTRRVARLHRDHPPAGDRHGPWHAGRAGLRGRGRLGSAVLGSGRRPMCRTRGVSESLCPEWLRLRFRFSVRVYLACGACGGAPNTSRVCYRRHDKIHRAASARALRHPGGRPLGRPPARDTDRIEDNAWDDAVMGPLTSRRGHLK